MLDGQLRAVDAAHKQREVDMEHRINSLREEVDRLENNLGKAVNDQMQFKEDINRRINDLSRRLRQVEERCDGMDGERERSRSQRNTEIQAIKCTIKQLQQEYLALDRANKPPDGLLGWISALFLWKPMFWAAWSFAQPWSCDDSDHRAFHVSIA